MFLVIYLKKLYLISFICFILDFLSKFIIINTLNLEEEITIIKDFFSLIYIRNTGAAFGILKSHTLLLVFITLVFIYLFIRYVSKNTFKEFEYISLGLIFGGALGNFFDRIVNNYVIDFFSFNIFGYSFPVFNVADIFVVVGVFLLLFDYLGGVKWKIR